MLSDMKEIFQDPRKGKPGTDTVYLKSPEELYELLTPKRLEILIESMRAVDNPHTIKDVAQKTGRMQEAISRDVSFLEKHNLIEKIKKGRTALLKTKYKSLEIQLAE